MILGVYAMRDVHTGYMTPTVDQNDAVAMRNFSHAVQSGGVLRTHAGDFVLCRLGSFDSISGIISSQEPVVILRGSEVIARVSDAV